MMLNVALWSPLLSLIALSILYPFQLHYRGKKIFSIYAGILAFIGLISAFYLLYFSRDGSSIQGQIFPIFLTSLNLTPQISYQETLFILAVFLSVTVSIFIAYASNINATISILSSAMIPILIYTYFSNPVIRFSVFSMSAIAANFFLLNGHKLSFQSISMDFILQRISDFLVFFALFIFIHHPTIDNNGSLSIKLLFSAVIIRIFTVILVNPINKNNIKNFIAEAIFRKIILGIASLLFLFEQDFSLLHSDNFSVLIGLVFLVLLLGSLAKIIFYPSFFNTIEEGFNILLITSLILLYLNHIFFASSLLAICIIMYPFLTISHYFYQQKSEDLPKKEFVYKINILIVKIKNLTNNIIGKLLYFIGKSFSSIISPIFSGFLFHYLPTISIGILQIPLRIFYNGDIQRSLLFILASIGVYIYWWGK